MRPDWQVVVEISCKTSSVLFSVNNNAWQALIMSGLSQLGLSLVLDLVILKDKPITPHFSTGLIKGSWLSNGEALQLWQSPLTSESFRKPACFRQQPSLYPELTLEQIAATNLQEHSSGSSLVEQRSSRYLLRVSAGKQEDKDTTLRSDRLFGKHHIDRFIKLTYQNTIPLQFVNHPRTGPSNYTSFFWSLQFLWICTLLF